MKLKLSSLKNIAWAVAILVCLLALFVALIIAAVSPYRGPIERGGVLLGQKVEKAPESESDAEVQTGTGELLQLAESADAGQGYLDGLTFLCDSSLIGLRDYAILAGGTTTSQVWGSNAGNIPASSLADFQIRYPAGGTEISPAEAAQRDKPSRLVICLGSDGLSGIEEDTFVKGYTALIRQIREASPDTVIIVCSVSSVTTSYSGSDGLSPVVLATVNNWIRQVAADTGVYYADTASAVNDKANWLLTDYASANGKALNSAGLQKVLEYLRTHAI